MKTTKRYNIVEVMCSTIDEANDVMIIKPTFFAASLAVFADVSAHPFIA